MSLANKKFIVFIFFLSMLTIFAGLRPVGFDSDSLHYASWVELGPRVGTEPTFSLIVYFWDLFVDEDIIARMMFISYAVINMFILKLTLDNFTLKKTQALVLYFFLAIVSALQQAKRYKNLLHMFTLPISFFLYHFIHGIGVLTGFFRLATGTSPVQKIKEPWEGYGFYRIKLNKSLKK